MNVSKLPKELEEQLGALYYNPRTGFLSSDKFYRKALESGLDVTLPQVQTFLSQQEVAQIMKQTKKPKDFPSIVADLGSNYQVDLLVYDRYESQGYKYILMVVDVHSRYLKAVPLKSREKLHLPLQDILLEMGSPSVMNCDQEFKTKEVEKLAEQLGFNIIYSDRDEPNKNAIVERLNRTIAGRIAKWRLSSGRTDWPSIFQDIVEGYNDSHHRTIDAKPIDVWLQKDTNKQKIVPLPEPEFEVGDRVRHNVTKSKLAKGDTPTWTKQVYIISEKPYPNRYILKNDKTDKNLKQKFKPYQLQKVDSSNIVKLMPQAAVEKQRADNKTRNKVIREFPKVVGHEFESIGPAGEITVKKRLLPRDS